MTVKLRIGIRREPVTYQLALQRDVLAGKKSMSYQVVDGDEVDTYDFRVLPGPKGRNKAA